MAGTVVAAVTPAGKDPPVKLPDVPPWGTFSSWAWIGIAINATEAITRTRAIVVAFAVFLGKCIFLSPFILSQARKKLAKTLYESKSGLSFSANYTLGSENLQISARFLFQHQHLGEKKEALRWRFRHDASSNPIFTSNIIFQSFKMGHRSALPSQSRIISQVCYGCFLRFENKTPLNPTVAITATATIPRLYSTSGFEFEEGDEFSVGVLGVVITGGVRVTGGVGATGGVAGETGGLAGTCRAGTEVTTGEGCVAGVSWETTLTVMAPCSGPLVLPCSSNKKTLISYVPRGILVVSHM
jgi:hypothetical protein